MTLENELLEWLHRNLPQHQRLAVGLGDDGAVIAPSNDDAMHRWSGSTVVTTDLLTDGVDFLLDDVRPQQIGHKALGVNLSDLAAMAAKPVAAFVSLAVPRPGTLLISDLALAKGLYYGMLPLAQRFNLTIAGGDTNSWEGSLAISITAVGETTEQGPLTRSGGQAGDQLLVTGTLGGSILGRHLHVEPRVDEALLLHGRYEVHAGIDVSDGLALDTSRLARASGLGAVLDIDALPLSTAAYQLSEQDGRSATEHALGDGEDFELVLAVPTKDAEQMLHEQPLEIEITRIGELVEQAGLWQRGDDQELVPLEPSGFQHGDVP